MRRTDWPLLLLSVLLCVTTATAEEADVMLWEAVTQALAEDWTHYLYPSLNKLTPTRNVCRRCVRNKEGVTSKSTTLVLPTRNT